MDELLYDRLSNDDAIMALVQSINPVEPEPDSGLASLYWAQLGVEDVVDMSGPSGLSKWSYSFDVIDQDPTTVSLVLAAIHSSLSAWRSRPVQGCFRQTSLAVVEEQGYHGQATYDIWADDFGSFRHDGGGSLSVAG